MVRKTLDSLYLASGAVASLLIAAICGLVCTQVIFNIITRLGGRSVNLSIPSYGDIAGYLLAASSFLALAYTLTRGGHIRVNLVVTRLPARARCLADVFSLFVCAALALYATYFTARLVLESYEFGDMSPGIVAIPIWIPQVSVLLGIGIFSVALIDFLLRSLLSGNYVLDTHTSQESGFE